MKILNSSSAVISMLLMLISLFFSQSCTNKELSEKQPSTARVRVNTDWNNFSSIEKPTGMSVLVYDINGKAVRTALTNDITHADFELIPGIYKVLAYNQSPSEFGTVRFDNMETWDAAAVYAEATKSAWYKSKAPEQVLTTPEWIGTGNAENLEVNVGMVKASPSIRKTKGTEYPETNILCTLEPKNIIYTVSVTVYIKGIHNLKAARASLDGMAAGYMLGEGQPSEDVCTHLLEDWTITRNTSDPTQGYIKTDITSFGLPYGHKGNASENSLKLSLLLVDNQTKLDYEFPVGDNFQKGEDTVLRLEIIKTLDNALPDVKPENGASGGFDVNVDDWGDEDIIDIPV